MTSTWTLPAEADRTRLQNALDSLTDAMEQSPLLSGGNKDPNAFFVWDFAKRTTHVLTQVPALYNSSPVSMPEQFPSTSKVPAGESQTGPGAAKHAWQDVLDRSVAVVDMVNGTGMGAMLLMMSGLAGCAWDAAVKGKARDVKGGVSGREFQPV